MNKVKVLSLLTLLLAVLNVALIGVFALKKDKQKGPHRPIKAIVSERLGFDQDQVKRYESAIKEHRQLVGDMQREKQTLKKELFGMIGAGNSAEESRIIRKLADLQVRIEKGHFDHFEEIRSICTSEQLPAFEEFKHEMHRVFGQPPGHGPPPGHHPPR